MIKKICLPRRRDTIAFFKRGLASGVRNMCIIIHILLYFRLFGRWQEHSIDECESVKRTYNAFRAPHKAALHECLQLLTQAEELSLADEWYCSTCKEKQPGVKKLDLYEAPNILIIHLKRFRQVFC